MFETLGPPGVVVDDPFRKADRAFDRKSEIANFFAEILERAAAMDMVVQFADPWLDRLKAGLGDHLDQFAIGNFCPRNVLVFIPKRNGLDSFETLSRHIAAGPRTGDAATAHAAAESPAPESSVRRERSCSAYVGF